jgi:ABC-type Fe3+/spermidine/putrescine transport system ATPase subunit
VVLAVDGKDGIARLETKAGEARAAIGAGVGAGEAVSLTIRPERLKLGSAPADAVAWPATVRDVVYAGARRDVRLVLADGSEAAVEIANDGGPAYAVGDRVTAWFRPGDAWVIAAKE